MEIKKINIINALYKVSMIFTAIIIVISIRKETISTLSLWGNLIISGMIVMMEYIFFTDKNLTKKQYWIKVIMHFVTCFFLYILFSQLIQFNNIKEWDLLLWIKVISIYTFIYVIITSIYRVKHKYEVKELNSKLNKVKEKIYKEME